MKLVCVDAFWDAEAGFLGLGSKPKRPIDGLTEGKTYEGSPTTKVSGDGNIGFGSINSSIKFLVFNDNGEWQAYPLDCFKPA